MSQLFDLDWERVFLPNTPLPEILLRGTLMYLALFVLLRLVLKRQSASMEVTDLLVVVLIADAAQNGMAGGYRSVPEGVLLVATILAWDYALDWLGYLWPAFQVLVRPPPLPLVRDGKLLRRNMRRELITEDELMSQVRKQGLQGLDEVRLACMEGDGHISVIGRQRQAP
jgi:uncharacterized membrane protein YcaP (DUF421 family)